MNIFTIILELHHRGSASVVTRFCFGLDFARPPNCNAPVHICSSQLSHQLTSFNTTNHFWANANVSRKWSKDDEQNVENTTSSSNVTRKLASRDALDSIQLGSASSRGSHEAEPRRDEHVPHSICAYRSRATIMAFGHSLILNRSKSRPSYQLSSQPFRLAASFVHHFATQWPSHSPFHTFQREPCAILQHNARKACHWRTSTIY